MNPVTSKSLTFILHFSIVVFTSALVWFAFIYYPRVVNEYKAGNFPKSQIVKPVAASSYKFPIETPAYRVVWEEGSSIYYAFIEGKGLDEYVVNRDNAQLSLKTALSLDNLCAVKVLYISVENLEIPDKYQKDFRC